MFIVGWISRIKMTEDKLDEFCFFLPLWHNFRCKNSLETASKLVKQWGHWKSRKVTGFLNVPEWSRYKWSDKACRDGPPWKNKNNQNTNPNTYKPKREIYLGPVRFRIHAKNFEFDDKNTTGVKFWYSIKSFTTLKIAL